MSSDDRKLCVAVLAVAESTASTILGMYDVLESAGRDWNVIIERKPAEPALRTLIVSASGRGLRAPNGLRIESDCALAECPRPDVIVIPDVMVLPDEDLSGRYEAEIVWIRAAYDAGAVLATACTGALVLAETGLLDGHDVTTHWAYCKAMQARHPGLRVHPNRALVVSGDEHRLVMAGGGTSWHDLALYLIARFVDTEEAMRVARLQLLSWHDVGQQPFAAMARSRQSEDALIAKCQEWIARNYDRTAPVAAMARLSGLAERSFKRRFARATGMSPLEYVHTLRLEEAKQMLETTDLAIEALAVQAGYEDASFFGRLFRRRVGMTPAQYRKRFRALRQALSLADE
jgi:transcriptional regulator GlxA family with amidase domain